MNWRRVAWALRLYPRPWRKRYEAEVSDLTEELIQAGEATPSRAAAELVACAGWERARRLHQPRHALTVLVALVLVLGSVAYATVTLTGPGKKPVAGPINLQQVKGVQAVCEGSCQRIGYAPKRDLMVGLVAPVFTADHKTLVGHEYAGIGFVPLGVSPWAQPCSAETVVESAGGRRQVTTVPCRGTVVVPDVVGMFTPTGVAKLSGLGIAIALYKVHSSRVQPGHIAATRPGAGTAVHHNEPVVVDFSVPEDVATGWD
jgi:hypothetical protein